MDVLTIIVNILKKEETSQDMTLADSTDIKSSISRLADVRCFYTFPVKNIKFCDVFDLCSFHLHLCTFFIDVKE